MITHCWYTLLVVAGESLSLIGQNWLTVIKWHSSFNRKTNYSNTSGVSGTDNVLHKYRDILKDELGTLKGGEVNIELIDGATPKILKFGRVSYSLQDTVNDEIDRLVEIEF